MKPVDQFPPETPLRLADSTEIPRSAARTIAAAGATGWTAVATFARGTTPGKTRRVVDSLAVRLAWRGYRAVAVWEDGKFTAAYLWRLIDLPRRVGHRALLIELKSAAVLSDPPTNQETPNG